MAAVQSLQTLASRSGLLPLEVDAFVGRRAELDEIHRHLGNHPVVTLVGPGGVGKTRLALRAALRVALDWSYEACSPQERLMWDRLSVFAGSFGIDSAEDVCTYGDIGTASALDLVGALVEKSIVTRDRHSDDTRFRLLETVREYGRARLAERGELVEIQHRHAEWFAQLASRVRVDQISARQQQWAMRLDRELPNLRAALDFGLADPERAGTALHIAGCLHLFWISRGLLAEGRHWLEQGLAAHADPSLTRAQALFSAAALAGFQGDAESAAVHAAASRSLADVLDDVEGGAYAASVEGMVALFRGDLTAARQLLRAGIDGYRSSGDLLREIEVSVGLALACGLDGDAEGAEQVHERILAITRPREESWYQSYSLWALGIARWRDGDRDRAAELLIESLRLRRRMNDALGSLWCLEGLALVAADERDLERAAVLLAATAKLSAGMGSPPATFADLASAHQRCSSQVADALGPRRYDAMAARGAELDLDAAISLALGGDEVPPERASTVDPWSALTPREREVAALVASGLSNRAIAESLVISPRTAETHVERILTKLGLTSRTQVAAWATDTATPSGPARTSN